MANCEIVVYEKTDLLSLGWILTSIHITNNKTSTNPSDLFSWKSCDKCFVAFKAQW